jgi:hypothetical protein
MSAFNFKVVRNVTASLLKLVDNKPVFVRFETAAEKAKPAKTVKAGTSEVVKEPPFLARVTNLETGEIQEIILGAVLLSELDDGYPEKSYVGKAFRICLHKLDGKAYNTYDLDEIEVTPTEAPAADKPAKKA